MALFDFECVNCGFIEERVYKIEECPDDHVCPSCHGLSVKIISLGHGGIRCDSAVDVPWLASAVNSLQPDHEQPITTRGEYNRYLKDNNIIASG